VARLRHAATASASWGERYFHMCDADEHELPFCAAALTVFKELHELIFSEEQLAQVLAQHWLTQGVSGVGLPK